MSIFPLLMFALALVAGCRHATANRDLVWVGTITIAIYAGAMYIGEAIREAANDR